MVLLCPFGSVIALSLRLGASIFRALLLFFFIAYGQDTFGACAIVGVLFNGFFLTLSLGSSPLYLFGAACCIFSILLALGSRCNLLR